MFGKRSERVFEQRHSLGDELDWLDAEGPTSPALVDYITRHAAELRLLPVLQLPLLPRLLRRAGRGRAGDPRADRRARRRPSACRSSSRCSAASARLMYNSPEERAMIQPSPATSDGARGRRRHRLGRAEQSAGRPLPPEVQHPRPVRDLRRPHRPEQGLQGTVRILSGAT